jgi:predicted nucleic acid-binding protein
VIVVLDAGPIIHLSWIDQLQLLSRLFADVVIPAAVEKEILAPPAGTLGLDAIHVALGEGRLRVSPALTSTEAETELPGLGSGELEALILAEGLGADLLITDDALARREAAARGQNVTGTLGVLALARDRGLIESVLPIVVELRRLGQWVSEELVESIRQEEADMRRNPG